MEKTKIINAIKSIRYEALLAVAECVRLHVDESIFPDGLSKELLHDLNEKSLEQTIQNYILPCFSDLPSEDKFSMAVRFTLGWNKGFDGLSPYLWDLTSTWPPRLDWYVHAIGLIPKNFQDSSDRVILDIGSGTGLLPRILNYLGFNCKIIAVEPDPLWSAYLQKLTLPNLASFNVLSMPADESVVQIIGKDSCDAITSLMVLHHIEDKDSVIQDLVYPCLKSGGSFINMDKNLLPTYDYDNELKELLISNKRSLQLLMSKNSQILANFARTTVLWNSGPFNQQPHPPCEIEYLQSPDDFCRQLENVGLSPKKAFVFTPHSYLLLSVKQNTLMFEDVFYWALQNLKARLREINGEKIVRKKHQDLHFEDLLTSNQIVLIPSKTRESKEVHFNSIIEDYLGVKYSCFMSATPKDETWVYDLLNDNNSIVFKSEKSADEDYSLLSLGASFINETLLIPQSLRAELFKKIHRNGFWLSKNDLKKSPLEINTKFNEIIYNSPMPLCSDDWDKCDNKGVFIVSALDSIYLQGVNSSVAIIGLAVTMPWKFYEKKYRLIGVSHDIVFGKIRALLEVAARLAAELNFYPKAELKFEKEGLREGVHEFFHTIKSKLGSIESFIFKTGDNKEREISDIRQANGKTMLRLLHHQVDVIYRMENGSEIAAQTILKSEIVELHKTIFSDSWGVISEIIGNKELEIQTFFELPNEYSGEISSDLFSIILYEILWNLKQHAIFTDDIVLNYKICNSLPTLGIIKEQLCLIVENTADENAIENIKDKSLFEERGRPRLKGLGLVERVQKHLKCPLWDAEIISNTANRVRFYFPIEMCKSEEDV